MNHGYMDNLEGHVQIPLTAGSTATWLEIGARFRVLGDGRSDTVSVTPLFGVVTVVDNIDGYAMTGSSMGMGLDTTF